ncbi:phosphate ABC transporter permease PstA [Lysobacter sp. D1-1-M9]|uniref:phosphate ABC transporter permease PstA n=1 Tax=Novilysobacter longmucuonensis TaxID=3098603 RepID=UPI002FC67E44
MVETSPALSGVWVKRAGAWPDRAATVTMWSVALLTAAVFAWILGDLVRHGLPHLSWTFLTEAPRDAGRAGGIAPILVSTLMIMGVCLAVSVPIGVGSAVLLAEFSPTGWFGRVVRRSLDVLAGVPSIVFGLFGNAFFSIYLGLGFSILSGGLTLACMVLPILIRSSEASLRSVPDDYRKAAAALGISQAAAIWRILLPAATPGLLVGLVLGIGRALAETAALLFTSGYVDRMPGSLMDSGRALSVHIYDLAMNVPGGTGPAYATAFVLIMLLAVINLVTSWTADRWLHRRVIRA